MMVSFCAVFFPRGVLDAILNLIESVSVGFPSYSFISTVLFPNFFFFRLGFNASAIKASADLLSVIDLLLCNISIDINSHKLYLSEQKPFQG